MPHTECRGCRFIEIIGDTFDCEKGVHQSIVKGLPVPAFGDCDFYSKEYSQ